MEQKPVICNEISSVAHNLLAIYQELLEFSHEVEYRNKTDTTDDAGDDLKYTLTSLMDEIQRLYPVDY